MDAADLKWWQNTIAYEIYVKSFKDSDGDGIGDLNGITSELDHLKELGVGAVWLTPCYVSPQVDNGYDIADYYNIDSAYGTMEDMDRLIAEAKKRDIRIVMDLVFNHTSDENEWFKESRSGRDNDKSDWYIWADPKEDGSAPTNWRSIFGGSAWEYDKTRGQYYLHTFHRKQPDLNWENPKVRAAVTDVAKFWRDKGVGGFRMDAITYIKKPSEYKDGTPDASDGMTGIHPITANTPGILDFLHEFRSAVCEGYDIFTVGEADGITAQDLKYWVGEHGVFDMVFEFGLVNIDLPDPANWCDRRMWGLRELKAFFSESIREADAAGGWFPVFLENHDQPRSINHFMPESGSRDAKAKALATLLLTMRGTPFIMQGEELGFVNVDWSSIDEYDDIFTKNHYAFALEEGYTKEEAIESVRLFSRDSSRTPMQWDATENAGFTSGTPWLPVYPDYMAYNRRSEKEAADSILNYYIALARLRSGHKELIDGSYEEIMPEDESIFAFIRKDADRKAVVLINFKDEKVSYAPEYVKDAECIMSSTGSAQKGMLAPFEAVIYEEDII